MGGSVHVKSLILPCFANPFAVERIAEDVDGLQAGVVGAGDAALGGDGHQRPQTDQEAQTHERWQDRHPEVVPLPGALHLLTSLGIAGSDLGGAWGRPFHGGVLRING